MRDLPHVHLLREMPQHRLLERLVGRQRPARERPATGERLAGALPEQRLQPPVANLENGREHGVRRSFRLGVVNHVDSALRLSLVRQKRQTCDVLVVGAGVAGLSAALAAADAGASVLVLAKASHTSSNSYAAQGGVAAAVGPDDDPALHAADTLSAGRGICRPSARSSS